MCGIVAYLGKNKIDIPKFKLLLLLNKDRGGDATGISLNGNVYKSVDSIDTFITKNTINYYKKGIAIGHVRKKSAGINSKEQAHPIIVYSDGDTIKYQSTEKPEFILVMNGTVTNIKELSTKYGTKMLTNDSDSQHIAKILHKLGKEDFINFFSEYEGACTSIFYWTDEPGKVYISKDIERPLFVYEDVAGDIWLSSKEDSLTAVTSFSDEKDFSIQKYQDNAIHIYENSVLTKTIKFKKYIAPFYSRGEIDYSPAHQRNFNKHMYKSKLTDKLSGHIKDSKRFHGIEIFFDTNSLKYCLNPKKPEEFLHGSHKLQNGETFNFLFGNHITDDAFYNEMITEYPDLAYKAKFIIQMAPVEVSNYSSNPVKGLHNIYYQNKLIGGSSSVAFKLPPCGLIGTCSSNITTVSELNLYYFQGTYNYARAEIILIVEELLDNPDIDSLSQLWKTVILKAVESNIMVNMDEFILALLHVFSNVLTKYEGLNFIWQSVVLAEFNIINVENTDLLMIIEELLYLSCTELSSLFNSPESTIFQTFFIGTRKEFLTHLESVIPANKSCFIIGIITLYVLEFISIDDLLTGLITEDDIELETLAYTTLT